MLEKINKPNDIHKIALADFPQLADEIRQFLIESVSQTGGHLASNLGVVELTLALHNVLDLPQRFGNPLIPPSFRRFLNPSFLPVRILWVYA